MIVICIQEHDVNFLFHPKWAGLDPMDGTYHEAWCCSAGRPGGDMWMTRYVRTAHERPTGYGYTWEKNIQAPSREVEAALRAIRDNAKLGILASETLQASVRYGTHNSALIDVIVVPMPSQAWRIVNMELELLGINPLNL
jgi:hypothetical protein